jgi:RES domain-containing protein
MKLLICYRALNPAWSHAPLSGRGAALKGGRWNSVGQEALYVAMDPITALHEYQQSLCFHPVTLAEYHIAHATVADLTADTSLLPVAIPADIHSVNWFELHDAGLMPPQWPIAAALVGAGYHGLIYPSARNRLGKALCLWRWNETGGPRVIVHDPDGRLPRDPSSWPPS